MKNLIQSTKDYEHQDEADSFIKFLDKSEGKSRSTKKFKKKKSFAPSGLGYGSGRCPRYWYYAFNGEEFDQRFRGSDVRTMDNGIDTHERFQKALEESGIVIEDGIEQVARHDDPPVFGYIDGIVNWAGRQWVIEFKTCRTEYFDLRRKQLKPPKYHLVQILLYMYVTGIRQGMIVYQDNNDNRRTAIAVQWNEEYGKYIDTMISWMRMVYKTVYKDGVKPKRGFRSKSSPNCKKCPVRNICWSGEEDGEIKLKNLPNIKA